MCAKLCAGPVERGAVLVGASLLGLVQQALPFELSSE